MQGGKARRSSQGLCVELAMRTARMSARSEMIDWFSTALALDIHLVQRKHRKGLSNVMALVQRVNLICARDSIENRCSNHDARQYIQVTSPDRALHLILLTSTADEQ